jgi:hypothetical protein
MSESCRAVSSQVTFTAAHTHIAATPSGLRIPPYPPQDVQKIFEEQRLRFALHKCRAIFYGLGAPAEMARSRSQMSPRLTFVMAMSSLLTEYAMNRLSPTVAMAV